MYSVWESNLNINKFNKLNNDIKTDVLIIGGGIAGILCANELKNAGIDYILAEAETIGNGITKNTRPVCFHRLQQMGNDICYGFCNYFERFSSR